MAASPFSSLVVAKWWARNDARPSAGPAGSARQAYGGEPSVLLGESVARNTRPSRGETGSGARRVCGGRGQAGQRRGVGCGQQRGATGAATARRDRRGEE